MEPNEGPLGARRRRRARAQALKLSATVGGDKREGGEQGGRKGELGEAWSKAFDCPHRHNSAQPVFLPFATQQQQPQTPTPRAHAPSSPASPARASDGARARQSPPARATVPFFCVFAVRTQMDGNVIVESSTITTQKKHTQRRPPARPPLAASCFPLVLVDVPPSDPSFLSVNTRALTSALCCSSPSWDISVGSSSPSSPASSSSRRRASCAAAIGAGSCAALSRARGAAACARARADAANGAFAVCAQRDTHAPPSSLSAALLPLYEFSTPPSIYPAIIRVGESRFQGLQERFGLGVLETNPCRCGCLRVCYG